MVTTPTSTPRGKGNARKTPLEQSQAQQSSTGAEEPAEGVAEDEVANTEAGALDGAPIESDAGDNDATREPDGGQSDADDEEAVRPDDEVTIVGPQRSVVLNIDTEHGDASELVRMPAADADLLLKREAARPATKADFGL